MAQLAHAIDVQHALQHERRVAAFRQQDVIARRMLFGKHLLDAAKADVDGVQIQIRHIVPQIPSAGRALACGALGSRVAVDAAIKASGFTRVARCELGGHEQGDGTLAEAVFVQQHVAPAVHAHLLAGIPQIANRKALAQQIGVAIAQVGEVRHEVVPLQADLLGQVAVEIEIVAVGNHADARPAGPVLLVAALQIVAQKGAQHKQIVHGQHHKGAADDGLYLEPLQQRLDLFEHGAPAALEGLVQGAAQGVQENEPCLGGGIGHAHVHQHGGPVHGAHALAAGAALKIDTGEVFFAFATLGMHPYFKAVAHQHFLRLQGAVQQKVHVALAAKLQSSGKKFYANRQFVKIAPDHKPGQCQKDVIGKKEPQGLLFFFAHQHAAVVEQRLPHGRSQFAMPADPQNMTHGAHAHVLRVGKTGQ